MVNTLHMVLSTTQLSMNIEHYSNHYSSQAFNNKAHARRTWNQAKGEKNISYRFEKRFFLSLIISLEKADSLIVAKRK